MPLELDRIRRILALAVPIIMAQASQNLVNLIDTALVGHLGDTALAAAGIGGLACYALQALPLGLGVGVQVLVAHAVGAGRPSEVGHPLGTGLLLSLVGGGLLAALCYPLAPWLCSLLSDDPQVAAQGAAYLQMRLLGTPFISMAYCFGGFWNATQRPRVYLGILLGAHMANVLVSYLLIFGRGGFPALGIAGAGIGTSVSWGLAAVVAGLITVRVCPWPGRITGIAPLIRLSLPNGVQQLSLFSGFTVFYGIVGLLGTQALAAAHVLVNILTIAILPGLGFGMAGATLVGQALGRGDPRDATRWGWQVMGTCLVLVAIPMLALLPWGQGFLSLFIHDSITRELAATPFVLTALVAAVDAAGLSIMYASLGAGDTLKVMKVSMAMQWGLFLPLAYAVGPLLGLGMLGVWVWFALYRLLQALAFSLLWYRRGQQS